MAFEQKDITTLLYEDIVVGAYSFGAKLVEERLTDIYGTKRHILREAFGYLEELGFVERIPNRGVFVREPDPKEVRELYELRTLLETNAAREMSLPVAPEILDEMRRIQKAHSAAIEDMRFRDVLHLNAEFHRVQYSACGNGTLGSAIDYYATRTHLITALKLSDADAMKNVVAQHEAIIAAMSGTDHRALEDAVRTHFNMSRVDEYQRAYHMRHGGRDQPSSGRKTNADRLRIGRTT